MSTVLKTGRGLALLRGIVCGLVLFASIGRDSIVAAQSSDPRAGGASTSPGAHHGPRFRARARAASAAARAPVAGSSNDSLPEAEDPEEITDAFLDQDRKLVEAQLRSLKEEAVKLKRRLTKVEASVMRLDRVLEAIKQGRGTTGPAVPPSQDVFPDVFSYFRQPFESTIPPPEGAPHLEGKKVVILCSVASAAADEYPPLAREVPRMLADILRNKVEKITVVEPAKVTTWVEAHQSSNEPADAARDFGADIAVFLEVEQFQTQSPGDLNMLLGESKVHIQVFELDYRKNSRDEPIEDQPKESHAVYDGHAESTFPNRGPLPIDSGKSRSAFTQTFLKIVVKEISWHFIEHRQEDTIQNSRIGTKPPGMRDATITTSKRVEDLLKSAESVEALGDNWQQWWLLDQPSHMTPFRTHGGTGP
jgi:hypothetical protein